jgi:polyphosphate kinase
VEAIAPVDDPKLRARLAEVLDVNLADDVLAWELAPDGTWEKVTTEVGIDAQRRLRELALSRARVA